MTDPMMLDLHALIGAPVNASQRYSTGTTSTLPASRTLTMADIERIGKILDDMPPEPIAVWMESQGCPHWRGWTLVLPEAWRPSLGPFGGPDYLKFSSMIDTPVFIRGDGQRAAVRP